MTEAPALQLEVLHRVRGRLRIGVAPANPQAVEHLVAHAAELAGVAQVEVGRSGRNLVVHFDPARLDEERLLTRLAFEHAADNGFRPVRVVRARGSGAREQMRRDAIGAGLAAAMASAAQAAAPATSLAGFTGWTAAALTGASVGGRVARDLAQGRPRPEGLALLHLLSRLGHPDRAYGALATWLLYHGPALAESARGAAVDAFELVPRVRGEVGGDAAGRHVELVTRALPARGAMEGTLLTPGRLVSAALGYLVFALGQGWLGGR